MNPYIITRQEAIDRGLLRYFTGEPCKRGHISHRYTKNCACIKCLRESNQTGGYQKKWYAKKKRFAALAKLAENE